MYDIAFYMHTLCFKQIISKTKLSDNWKKTRCKFGQIVLHPSVGLKIGMYGRKKIWKTAIIIYRYTLHDAKNNNNKDRPNNNNNVQAIYFKNEILPSFSSR